MSFRRMIGLCLVVLLASCGPQTIHNIGCDVNELIDAINDSNATPALEDTINLSAGCLYELTVVDNATQGNNGLPSITSPIVINGNQATIQRSMAAGTPSFRIFHVSNVGALTLNDLTVANGLAFNPATGETANNAGGGIYNDNRLSLYGVVIEGNHAKWGGGIYNTIANGMTVNTSTFQNNGADAENAAGERGGAIFNLSGLTITQSTFNNNSATETGGAIENGASGRLALSNSTFSANSTDLLGGSAILNSGEIIVMAYTTITENMGGAPGAALLSGPDTIEIRNSIIANNTGGDCSYPASSSILWENLDSDGSCTGFTLTDDPDLNPLADNGGPTLTHALTPSSPARDAAAGNCSSIDQRGEPRPHGAACDLGAYEFSGGPPPAATATSTVTPTMGVPDLVITNVILSTTTPPAGGWVEVEVTIENQGGATATGFELVLIPHYGWGPPNPAGYQLLPNLAPGAVHVEAFSPGVLYANPGTYTLRVLVTDDWYAIGDPDSTGSAGDYQDFTITVLPPPSPTSTSSIVSFATILKLSLCWVGPGDPYDVISSIPPETRVELLGTGEGGGYLVILNPRYGVPCWVKEGDADVGGLDLSDLPVFKIPPLPTPTPTPVPPVGCLVSSGQTSAPKCVYPCPDVNQYPDTCTP